MNATKLNKATSQKESPLLVLVAACAAVGILDQNTSLLPCSDENSGNARSISPGLYQGMRGVWSTGLDCVMSSRAPRQATTDWSCASLSYRPSSHKHPAYQEFRATVTHLSIALQSAQTAATIASNQPNISSRRVQIGGKPSTGDDSSWTSLTVGWKIKFGDGN